MTKHDTALQARPPLPTIPSLGEDTARQLVPLAGTTTAEPPKGPESIKQLPRVAPAGRKRRTLSHRTKIAVCLVVVALALTLVLTAGIGAGSFLIAWISSLTRGSGSAVQVPIHTGAIVSAAGGLAVLVLAVRYGAERFSKHKYPHFSCEACKGGGKDWEPRLLRLLRWGRRRAWRKRPACDGGTRPRTDDVPTNAALEGGP